jgi:hypothetical protein
MCYRKAIMIAALEKTVTIGADKRVTLDLSDVKDLCEGEARLVLFVLDGTEQRADAVPVHKLDGSKAGSLAELAKSPSTEEMLAEAEKIWAYNRAHPEEVRATLNRLKEHGPLFAGIEDGVTYQRQIRDEWEDRLVKMGLSNIPD